MNHTQSIRPKVGRPPASAGEPRPWVDAFEPSPIWNRKRVIALGVMAAAAIGLLSALLVAQNQEGVKSQKALAALAPAGGEPDASEAVSVRSPSGNESLTGSMVVVGPSGTSFAAEPNHELSEEDKKRLLEIIGRH